MKANLKLLSMATLLIACSLLPFATADDITTTASVSKEISATFNYNAVAFGSLTSGTSDNHPAPDYTTGFYNVSITTNFEYTVSASGTDFSGSGHTFGIGNLTFDTNNTLGSLDPTTALTVTPAVIDTYADTVTQNFHGFLIGIPANQYAAAYTSTVTLTYANT